MKSKNTTDEFVQGYAVAVTHVAFRGHEVLAEEMLNVLGHTTKAALKRAGVQDYDLKTLAPILKSIRENKRYEKTTTKK